MSCFARFLIDVSLGDAKIAICIAKAKRTFDFTGCMNIKIKYKQSLKNNLSNI